MKRILLFISLLVSVVGFSQTQPPFQTIGNAGNEVKINGIGSANKGFSLRNNYADTTAMNLDTYLKNVAGVQARSGDTIWQRSSDATRWFKTGAGSIIADTSSTIQLHGDGSSGNPLTADLIISQQANNRLQSLGDGIYVSTTQNGLIEGGLVTWVSGYTYDVAPAVYGIGSVEYESDYTQVTLANADPTNNRFDLIVANTSNGVTVITGTPSSDPQVPSYDPLTQLPIATILVTANTSEPSPTPTYEYIYLNNNEWTTVSSTARINVASTNNPYSPTLDIEATLAQNGDYVKFTPTVAVDLSDYNILTFFIRSKLLWANASSIVMQWYDGNTPAGLPVYLNNSAYGFFSGSTSSYQIVSIGMPNFGQIITANNLRMTVTTVGGATIGFYIDNVQLQNGVLPNTGNFWAQGGNSWGQTGIFGTNDDHSIVYKTNNTERMRLLNGTLGGHLLINATTSIGSYKLQVNGTAYGLVGYFPQIVTDASSNNGNFAVRSGTGVGSNDATQLQLEGSTNISSRVVMRGSSSPALSTGHSYANMTMGEQGVSIASSGYPLISGLALRAPAITGAGSATNMATLYVSGSPSGASVTDQRNAIWVASGNTRFGKAGTATGTISFEGATSGRIGIQPASAAGTYTLTLPTDDGTSNQVLTTDGNGVLSWSNGSGISAITADEGLTANTSTNVRIGGTITANRTITTTSNSLIIDGTTASGSLYAKSTSGIALLGQSTTGDAVYAYSTDGGTPLVAFQDHSSTNTARPLMVINRATTGTAAAGIGTFITFYTEKSNGSLQADVNTIVSKLTDVGASTFTSEFSITGVNSGISSTLLTLNGNGSIKFNDYGTGANTGTAAYNLQVDASGNIIEGAVGGGTYTASNGLIMTSNDVQLGSTSPTGAALTATRYVYTNTNTLNFLGVGTGSTVGILNQNVVSGVGLDVTSDFGVGANIGTSNGSYALGVSATPTTTNTVQAVLRSNRLVAGGTAADGIGGSFEFYTQHSNGQSNVSNQLISKLTTANSATRVSQFIITGVNSAVTADLLTISGSGSTRLNKYGVNTFAGVAAYVLGVDASGNIVEVAAAGAGMTNVLTTTGDIIYSSSGTTPARLGIGTNGQVLTVSGGVPVWSTVVGTGSVTDFVFTDANGVDGTVTTSTTTPTLSLAFTPNGMLKSNGTTLSAATSGTDYSAGTSALATGILKSTTTTGALTIAVAADFPTLNQNTTGSAATLTTSRNINGVAFNGSADITVTAAAGTLTGTTLASNVVTSSLTAVGTIATGVWQGTAIGDTYISSAATWNAKQTGDATLTALAGLTITNGSIIYGTGADAFSVLSAGTNGHVLTLAGGVPTWAAAGSGTLTNITWTGGIVSIANPTTTPALTIAGTSGGIPYFSSSSTWASSGALTANAIVLGGGAGSAPTSLALGSANQIVGMNSGGTANEYKTFSATNGAAVTHAANSVVISTVFNPTVQTLTDGATITWNVTNGGNAKVTLAGTGRTLSISNPVAGYTYTIEITQGSGGSKTITTWPTGTTWTGSNTLSTTAGDIDVVVLYYNGTNYRAQLTTDYN